MSLGNKPFFYLSSFLFFGEKTILSGSVSTRVPTKQRLHNAIETKAQNYEAEAKQYPE